MQSKTRDGCATHRFTTKQRGCHRAHVPPAIAGVPPSSLSNALQRLPRNSVHLHDETEGRIKFSQNEEQQITRHFVGNGGGAEQEGGRVQDNTSKSTPDEAVAMRKQDGQNPGNKLLL